MAKTTKPDDNWGDYGCGIYGKDYSKKSEPKKPKPNKSDVADKSEPFIFMEFIPTCGIFTLIFKKLGLVEMSIKDLNKICEKIEPSINKFKIFFELDRDSYDVMFFMHGDVFAERTDPKTGCGFISCNHIRMEEKYRTLTDCVPDKIIEVLNIRLETIKKRGIKF